MKVTFTFSDGTVLTGAATENETKAIELFTRVQGSTPAGYFKKVIDAAIKTAVDMVELCGGIDVVSGVLARQGGEKQ